MYHIKALLIAVCMAVTLASCGDPPGVLANKKNVTWTEMKAAITYVDERDKSKVVFYPGSLDSPHLFGMPDASVYPASNGSRIQIWFDRVILDGPTIPKKHLGKRANVVIDDLGKLSYYITGEPDEGEECKTPHTRLGHVKAATTGSLK